MQPLIFTLFELIKVAGWVTGDPSISLFPIQLQHLEPLALSRWTLSRVGPKDAICIIACPGWRQESPYDSTPRLITCFADA